MERIILVAHGSMRREANNIDLICNLLHKHLHSACDDECVKASYLQFSRPHIKDVIIQSIEEGARKIIIHPFFLSAGNHVTDDIPAIIDDARVKYPFVEFIYTEPLGIHEKLIQVIIDRIHNAGYLSPNTIEERSFEIIDGEIELSHLSDEQRLIIKRIIHATADLDFANDMLFHKDAIEKGLEAIRQGADILTDVEMVRAGINEGLIRKWNCNVHCHIADKDVKEQSEKTNKTRAEIGIEKGLLNSPGIVLIGNAPTSLLKTIEFLNNRPNDMFPLVIGVPVGFVNALESKTLLSVQGFPFITNLSKKGGSAVAVAIINALLKMA